MKRAYWLVFAALLSGCLHSAPGEVKKEVAPAAVATGDTREISAAVVQQLIVKGKTTKAEILAALGSPIAVEKNPQQLSREMLAKIKVPLPPIARTKEFWKYRSNPFAGDKVQSTVFKVLIFMDENDVALDYTTAQTQIKMP